MEDLPPRFNSAVFNSSAFSSGNPITKIDADRLYVPLSALGPSGSTSPGKIIVADSTGQLGVTKVNGGDMITLSTSATTARATIKFVTDTQSWEAGTRGSASSNPNTFYIYNGNYRLLMQPNGDTRMLSTTISSSKTTGSLVIDGGLGVNEKINAESLQIYSSAISSSKTTGAFVIAGGIGCSGTITSDRVRVDSSSSHLTLINGANSVFMECTTTNMMRLVAGGGTMAMNITSVGCVIGNGAADPKCRLDLGAPVSSNMILSLYNSLTSYYGFSANNVSLQSSSFGAFTWYSNCTDASPINTLKLTLAANGVLTTTDNIVATKGLFIPNSGFSSNGRSGVGIAMHTTNSTYGEIFCYDYGPNNQKSLWIGNTIYVNGVAGSNSVNINGGPNSSLYPLSVAGSSSGSIGTYGYVNQAGNVGQTSTSPVPISIYAANRVACTEVNCFSDVRLKENIIDVDVDQSIEFVRNILPKNYNWKCEKDRKMLGYVAQDVIKYGLFNEIIAHSDDPDLEELVEEVDGRKFISPAKQRLNVSYQSITPILHKALANAFDQIDELRMIIETLTNKPTKPRAKKKII